MRKCIAYFTCVRRISPKLLVILFIGSSLVSRLSYKLLFGSVCGRRRGYWRCYIDHNLPSSTTHLSMENMENVVEPKLARARLRSLADHEWMFQVKVSCTYWRISCRRCVQAKGSQRCFFTCLAPISSSPCYPKYTKHNADWECMNSNTNFGNGNA